MSLEIAPLTRVHLQTPWLICPAPEEIHDALLRLNSTGGVALALVLDAAPVGFCTIKPSDPPSEWSIDACVDQPFWEQGIGLAGVQAALRIAFETRGIARVYATVKDGLRGSGFMSRVAARIGAAPLKGEEGSDETYYVVTKQSWENSESSATGGRAQ
jgi:hypothetical protein